jgi:hypothetical protein
MRHTWLPMCPLCLLLMEQPMRGPLSHVALRGVAARQCLRLMAPRRVVTGPCYAHFQQRTNQDKCMLRHPSKVGLLILSRPVRA